MRERADSAANFADRDPFAKIDLQTPLPTIRQQWHDTSAARDEYLAKLSDEDLARVKGRCQTEAELCVLGLRFSHDRNSPGERFQRLREELGDKFVAVEIDSSPGNPHGHPRTAHSVLTEHLKDEPGQPSRDALDKVLELFRTRLL